MLIYDKLKKTTSLILYVNDMLMTLKDKNENAVIKYLEDFYPITSLGEAKNNIGVINFHKEAK